MIARFRAWLRDLLDGGWDEVDGPTYASDDPCTCTPAAVGPRGSSCPRCGGGVVYLSEHPTDEAARLLAEDAEKRANFGHALLAAVLDYEEAHGEGAHCFEPELNRTVPFDILYNAAKGRVHVDTTGFTDRPLSIADLAAMRNDAVDALRDPDDLPSTADPGVVTDPKEE